MTYSAPTLIVIMMGFEIGNGINSRKGCQENPDIASGIRHFPLMDALRDWQEEMDAIL